MESIRLTEEEMELIQSYVKNVNDFYALECIYLLPFMSEGKERIHIVTILKGCFACKGLVTERTDDFYELLRKDGEFMRTHTYYCDKSKNTRLSFKLGDARFYETESFSPYWLQELVNSTIIYDESSKLTGLRNSNLDKCTPYSSILSIDNLDELNINGSSLKKEYPNVTKTGAGNS